MASNPPPEPQLSHDVTEPADLPPPSAGIAAVSDSGTDTVLLVPGSRPVPDFELVELLGRGGFGEVWKANGPGGFAVALKFIRLEERAGSMEVRSLGVMKDIRHPHLLSMFGTWQRASYLIIAMELADRTLMDHWKQTVRDTGTNGIPPVELIEFMREAAKGIDHLNGLGIQHRDIKPQNLLLAGGGVKVADFGLAKLLEKNAASNTGAMTPGYAAPEFLNRQTSSQSDQYALAVTYCLLRGGRLPFEGTSAQVMTGHLMHAPDLTMLPEPEQEPVARALAKKPEERWPSCKMFIDAVAAKVSDFAQTANLRLPSPVAFAATEVSGQGSRTSLSRSDVTSPVPVPEPAPQRSTWAVVFLGVVALAAVVAVALLGPWFRFGDPSGPVANGKLPPGPEQTSVNVPTPPDLPEVMPPPVQRMAQPPTPEPVKPPQAVLQLLPLDDVILRPGENKTLTVRVQREHCAGPIQLDLEELPTGVSSRLGLVPDGADSGEIQVLAAAEAVEASKLARLVARASQAKSHAEFRITVAKPKPAEALTNSLGMKLRRIPAGLFQMGAPANEEGFEPDETVHEVTITKPFYLGTYEVTVGQFKAFVQATGHRSDAERSGKAGLVAGNKTGRPLEVSAARYNWRDPNWDQSDDHPVTLVSWNDAIAFCRWLSNEEKRTYRLPTEAEWEYACRAGTKTRFSGGTANVSLVKIANVADLSLKPKVPAEMLPNFNLLPWDDEYPFTAPVGKFAANAWGLHDMHGNVWEWCEDWYSEKTHSKEPRVDPRGPAEGDYRILRGGSWASSGNKARAAFRNFYDPVRLPTNETGFRVVLEAP